jgi:hypothetical protein
LRNRASAQKSRDNRKQLISSLESENLDLKQKLISLQNQLNSLLHQRSLCTCQSPSEPSSLFEAPFQNPFDLDSLNPEDYLPNRNSRNHLGLFFIALTCIVCCVGFWNQAAKGAKYPGRLLVQ